MGQLRRWLASEIYVMLRSGEIDEFACTKVCLSSLLRVNDLGSKHTRKCLWILVW